MTPQAAGCHAGITFGPGVICSIIEKRLEALEETVWTTETCKEEAQKVRLKFSQSYREAGIKAELLSKKNPKLLKQQWYVEEAVASIASRKSRIMSVSWRSVQ